MRDLLRSMCASDTSPTGRTKAIGLVALMILLPWGTNLPSSSDSHSLSDDFDLRRDFQNYMKSERAKEWDFIMRKFQEPVPGAEPDELWSPMEEVFSLES